MITSVMNKSVKEVMQFNQRARARNKQGLFVAEGVKMFAEAPQGRIAKVYIAERMERGLREQYGEKLDQLSCEIVSDEVFDRMSDTKTPQGVLCLVRQFRYSIEDMLNGRGRAGSSRVRIVVSRPVTEAGDMDATAEAESADKVESADATAKASIEETANAAVRKPVDQTGKKSQKNVNGKRKLFILLENLQDPGNLGTIFRAGEGAGVDGIIMSGKTVDIYNPKTIRSTMGSVYRVPFLYTDDLCGAIRTLQEHGVSVYAAQPKADKYYDEYDYRKNTAFLIGNEGSGLSEEAAGCADGYLKIPMKGSVESLNAAVASSLLVYEAFRQRRHL